MLASTQSTNESTGHSQEIPVAHVESGAPARAKGTEAQLITYLARLAEGDAEGAKAAFDEAAEVIVQAHAAPVLILDQAVQETDPAVAEEVTAVRAEVAQMTTELRLARQNVAKELAVIAEEWEKVEAPSAIKSEPVVEHAAASVDQASEARSEAQESKLLEWKGKVEGILGEYQKSGEAVGGKILRRKLLQLQAEVGASAKAGDTGAQKMALTIQRVQALVEDKIFEVPSDPGGREKEMRAIREELFGVQDAASEPQKIEMMEPGKLASEFIAAGAEIVAHKGKVSSDLYRRIEQLVLQRSALRLGDRKEEWKKYSEACDTLVSIMEKQASHPVGMVQALEAFLSDSRYRDFAEQMGIQPGALGQLKQELGHELGQNLTAVRDDLGSIGASLLTAKGEIPFTMALQLEQLQDKLDVVGQVEGDDKMKEKGWQSVQFGLDHLKQMLLLDHPAERVKALRTFAGDHPDIAEKFGFTEEAFFEAESPDSSQFVDAEVLEQAQLSRSEGVAGVMRAATSAERSENSAEVEEALAKTKMLNEDMDAAVLSGDEVKMKIGIGNVEKHMRGQIAIREAELQGLRAIRETERSPAQQARMTELETANEHDQKLLERRKHQLELMGLQKEKQVIDAEVASMQGDLERYQRSDAFFVHSAALRSTTIPGLLPKAELETRLVQAVEKQKELGGSILKTTEMIKKIEDEIAVLGQQMEEAQSRQVEEEVLDGSASVAAGDYDLSMSSGPSSMGGGFGGSASFGSGGGALHESAHGGGGGGKDVGERAIGAVMGALHDPGSAAADAAIKAIDWIGGTKGGPSPSA